MFGEGWREAAGRGDELIVDELIHLGGGTISAAAFRVVLAWTHGGRTPTLNAACALQSMKVSNGI